MSKSRDHALLLLEKADEDLFALERLGVDSLTPQSLLGFHAQQAVEKCLKAVLASQDISFPWTHDLDLLLDLLGDHEILLPPDAGDLGGLTPFAAELRYGRLPREQAAPEPLDVRVAIGCAMRTREWAQRLV